MNCQTLESAGNPHLCSSYYNHTNFIMWSVCFNKHKHLPRITEDIKHPTACCVTYLMIQSFLVVRTMSIIGCLSFEGRRWSWSRSQLTLGQRWGSPWTGPHSIPVPIYTDQQPFTLTPTVESINLTPRRQCKSPTRRSTPSEGCGFIYSSV